ncbi:hypothetical protein HYV12_02820 [Candidatus Dojkabacteria bacterium]|nr:hypothetical protein [Candidatus Dojkabacteria bacterium]
MSVPRKLTHLTGLLLAFLFLFMGFATYAANEASVAATVTVQNISVSVADGTIAYGTLASNTSVGTNGTDTQVVTNDSNVTVDVDIKGQNSANWTLAGTAGSDTYVHKFCSATCGTPPTNYTALTTSYATLANSVAASGTVNLDLYLTTPTVSTNFTSQNVGVMVLVSLP